MSRLVPTLRLEDVDQLISVRDGSTHYLAEGEALESLVIPFLGTFLLLQQYLELSDADVFGSDAELVSFVREKHTKEVDRKVAAKIAQAKHAFEARYGHLDAEARKVVFRAIEANLTVDRYDAQTVPCPACESTGVTSGQHEFQRWEADVDDDGTPSGAYPIVLLFAGVFKCSTCGLQLEGPDELVAAGLESVLDVEEADAEDFYDRDDEYDPADWADRFEPDSFR